MHTVDFPPGCHIATAAAQLVDAAKKHGEASGRFNDIVLTAGPQTTPESVVAYFTQECEARAEAYRRSPEGRAAAKRDDAERSDLQATHDALMRRLPALDFGNDVAVLDWLCQMQPASDRVGVIIRKNAILDAFAKHGFTPGVNCGPDFRPESRENSHRWLVGQALDGIERAGAIHGIVHKFADDWRAKFVRETATV